MSECAVLVVDDDPGIREATAELLELEGYLPRTASNGLEALESVNQDCPDLVLLDMRMPLMDGWQFAREIQPLRDGLKIVVMTAARDAQQSAADIDADGVLSKPFDVGALLTEVHRLCPRPPG
jgi:urea transport system substrate-binding protein